MVRVADLDASLSFYCDKLGLKEVSRNENPMGRFTLVFLCAPADEAAARAGHLFDVGAAATQGVIPSQAEEFVVPFIAGHHIAERISCSEPSVERGGADDEIFDIIGQDVVALCVD
eukprot:gene61526-84157_t